MIDEFVWQSHNAFRHTRKDSRFEAKKKSWTRHCFEWTHYVVESLRNTENESQIAFVMDVNQDRRDGQAKPDANNAGFNKTTNGEQGKFNRRPNDFRRTNYSNRNWNSNYQNQGGFRGNNRGRPFQHRVTYNRVFNNSYLSNNQLPNFGQPAKTDEFPAVQQPAIVPAMSCANNSGPAKSECQSCFAMSSPCPAVFESNAQTNQLANPLVGQPLAVFPAPNLMPFVPYLNAPNVPGEDALGKDKSEPAMPGQQPLNAYGPLIVHIPQQLFGVINYHISAQTGATTYFFNAANMPPILLETDPNGHPIIPQNFIIQQPTV